MINNTSKAVSTTHLKETSSFCARISERIDYFEHHSSPLLGRDGLIATAKTLHAEERAMTLLSVRIVGLLVEQNGSASGTMSQAKFAQSIGLTENQVWKRCQAYRVLKNYPEFADLVTSGETCVSHIGMLAAKITPANSQAFFQALPYLSTQSVRDLVARMTPDGAELSDSETMIDIKLRLTKEQLGLLDRAREVLAHGGRVPTQEEIFLKALGDLLDRRDPLRKAERAAQKGTSESPSLHSSSKNESSLSDEIDLEDVPTVPSSKQRTPDISTSRPKIPAAIKHSVWLRDQGQCTFKFPDGSRCTSKMMIEVDHVTPWARGGTHTEDNLVLRCRGHNQWQAHIDFGTAFMRAKIGSLKQNQKNERPNICRQ